MKKMNIVFAVFASILMIGGSVVPATSVDASTKYRRTKIVKVKHTKYIVRNKKGKTYKFKGNAKKLKLKTNHYLKNYAKSTWKRTKQTKVYRIGGKKVTYYYVTTSKHKAAGWVKKSDLKIKSNKKTNVAANKASSAKVVKQTKKKASMTNAEKANAESIASKEARVGTGSAGGGPMPSVW